MKKRNYFTQRLRGSLIVVALLIIGSLILAGVLYGAEPGDEFWEFRTIMMDGG